MPRPASSPFLIAAGGMALLCAMDAVIKYLGADHTVVTIAFGRYLVGTGFAFGLYAAAGRPRLTADMLRAHTVRGLAMAISAFLFFWALTALPLAETVALSFVAPLLIPFIARLLLGERLRATSLAAGLVGFAGVLIAVSGAGAEMAAASPKRSLGLAAVLGSAVAYALSAVLLRGRAARDGPAIVGVMNAGVPTLVLAPFAVAFGAMPQPQALPWFILTGLLGTAGIYLLSMAYARAEAQVLAPVEFTALAWAALLGVVLFHEVPGARVLIGASVIIAACLFAAWDERRRSSAFPAAG